MKRAFVVLFAVACAAPPPAKVAIVKAHVRTLGERRDDVCARKDLVPMGASVVGDELQFDSAIVRSVHVRDASNAEVALGDETTSAIRIGAPLTADASRETLQRVWQTGKFADVAIDTEPTSPVEAGAVSVIVRVVPKRTIANVFVSGDAQPDALHVSQGSTYDAVAITSAKRAVLDFERTEGHLDATLEVSSAIAEHDAVDVCVKLMRGPRVTIDAIKVHGSAYDAALTALLAREDTVNVPDKVPNEEMLARDDLVLTAELYDHGLLNGEVKRTKERHGASITIDFAIKDGVQFHYGVVDVKGDLAAPKGDYMKLVTLKQGDVFSRTEAMAVLEKVRAMAKSAAKKDDIEVEPETELDVANQSVALTIAIHDPHPSASTTQQQPRGFTIVELKQGQGRAAKAGDTVDLHYKGTLTNGTVFDSSYGRSPFSFKIGGGAVIKGFDRGVTGMRVGGKRRVTIPPDMAYGSRAVGNIPASSTLVFEIELLAIR